MSEDINDVNQFNNMLAFRREHDEYLRLTNYRDATIDDHEHKTTVLLGMYKIYNLINRRLVRAESTKRVSVE
jgi:hypothetical protein